MLGRMDGVGHHWLVAKRESGQCRHVPSLVWRIDARPGGPVTVPEAVARAEAATTRDLGAERRILAVHAAAFG